MCPRCVSEDGTVGLMVLATLVRGLDGWERRKDRLVDGNDPPPSVTGRFGGPSIREGIELRLLRSTNEGRVIMGISSDGFDSRSNVPPERITFLSRGIGTFRGEGSLPTAPGVPKAGTQLLELPETIEVAIKPRVEIMELDVSKCCGPRVWRLGDDVR